MICDMTESTLPDFGKIYINFEIISQYFAGYNQILHDLIVDQVFNCSIPCTDFTPCIVKYILKTR